MEEGQKIDTWDGLTEKQEAEVLASVRAHDRRIFWQFIGLLFLGKYSNGKGEKNALDDECSFWQGLYWRIACLLAMLLGRGYSSTDKSYEYYTLGWCNYHRDGYYWGCDMIEYNPKTFRYHICTDGECLY